MLLKRMQDAVKANAPDKVGALFNNAKDADYLFRMAGRDGGLKNLKVAVFESPKGWESTGKYWATFHAWQELEQDHDPIYRVIDTPQGMMLGAEIPEWDCNGKLLSANTVVDLSAKTGDVYVKTSLKYQKNEDHKALLFRLEDTYKDIRVWLGDQGANPIPVVDETQVGRPKNGFLRVGGLLAIEPGAGSIDLSYVGHFGAGAMYSDDRDQVLPDRAYITSFWVPSLGRLPFKSSVTVTAPKDWKVFSEGVAGKTMVQGETATTPFTCTIPITYPKVVAGKYLMASEGTQNGHTLRTYHFAPVDKKRATEDLDWMKKAIVFYEENLGPFPFKEYDCVDGKAYYGVESYSYTILDPSITTWAVSHEMGHTYFGGLVPCAYVKDSWNEGLTQYVDDVLLHQSTTEMEQAFAGIGVRVPLTEMPVAWEYDGLTYMRGAYVMQMLDAEIGHDKVFEGLRTLIKDRVGKETTWLDLRQYFEKSSGQDLKWFWDQWVAGAEFPTVSIRSATTKMAGGKWTTRVAVHQDGTVSPFRLRFFVSLDGVNTQELMMSADQTFEVVTDAQPKKVAIDPHPLSLIRVGEAVDVVAGS